MLCTKTFLLFKYLHVLLVNIAQLYEPRKQVIVFQPKMFVSIPGECNSEPEVENNVKFATILFG